MGRKNTIWIDWQGERRSLVEWARLHDIGQQVVRHRLQSGWSVERALTEPVGVHRAIKGEEAGNA
jgi:hypothetical protein